MTLGTSHRVFQRWIFDVVVGVVEMFLMCKCVMCRKRPLRDLDSQNVSWAVLRAHALAKNAFFSRRKSERMVSCFVLFSVSIVCFGIDCFGIDTSCRAIAAHSTFFWDGPVEAQPVCEAHTVPSHALQRVSFENPVSRMLGVCRVRKQDDRWNFLSSESTSS